MVSRAKLSVDDIRHIYDNFTASITRYDCGRRCAPLNGGEPVCCSTKNAVPVVHRPEWDLLRSRTDLWSKFKPYDDATRRIVREMSKACSAIECKGAGFCERDNRTIACRAFPFYPYITGDKRFVGLGHYWNFEDRCWMISHPELVTPEFVAGFVEAFEYVFSRDDDEFDVMARQSATARRRHSRMGIPFPVIGRDGGFFLVKPGDPTLHPADIARFKPYPTYRSKRAYADACRHWGYEPPAEIDIF